MLEKIHQKKRRLHKLKEDLASFENDNAIHLCFGGKKLFNAQYNLEANGYPDHEAWLTDWQAARSSEFVVLGSKDETAGCQGCVATLQTDGAFSLRLRLPHALSLSEKYLYIKSVKFAYGQDVIERALILRQALTYRFKCDKKGWRVFVSTAYHAPKTVTSTLTGALGVDINADCLAISEIDRFGNLIFSRKIDCIVYGKTSNQRKAIIGDATKEIIDKAIRTSKSIIGEKLDFKKKKARLEGNSAPGSRMISALAYSQIQTMLRAAAFRSGVEVITINPAYTSTIGAVNFAQRYGISIHQAAAAAIARRGMGFSEQPSGEVAIVPFRGGHVTFSLPERNREKHVWSFWSAVQGKLRVARAARSRSGSYLGPAPLRPALGATGSCRRDSGTRIASNTVRLDVIEDDIPL